MLRYAADLELVARVPTMKALKLPPSKHEFLDFDDFAKLVEAARQEPELYAAVLLAGEAGLRLGEIVGLHWSDIDRAGVLTVSHNDWRGHLGEPEERAGAGGAADDADARCSEGSQASAEPASVLPG